MSKIFFSVGLLTSALFIASCTNSNSSKGEETAHHDHNHDGHDHASHDHDGHDHAGHDHSKQDTTDLAAYTPEAKSAPVKAADPVASIPLFTFYKVKSGISFTNQDIDKSKKTAFILFDPSCSHCRDEAKALGKNYDKVKNVNLYFVSMNDPALMASFLETFAKELVNKPNVQVLYDKNQEFIQKFHVPKQFPANYVYSKEGKLESSWDGDKDIQAVIAAYTK